MSKTEAINPHFDEVTADQTWISASGELSLSLRLVPSTPEHYAKHIAAPEGSIEPVRSQYVDINEIRAEHGEDIARLSHEYEKRWIAKSEKEPGIQVELRIVNKGAEAGTIGVMTSWSTDAQWANEQAIVEALALQYPEHEIVFIVTPGMGESTKLTKERRKEMVESGSFEPMAEQMAGAIETTGLTFDVFLGISEGGRMAISLAEKLGAGTAVTVDPPGTKEQPFLTFAKKFAVDEAKGQKRVLENTPDRLMAQAHKEIDSKQLVKSGLMKIFKRNLVARAQAIAKSGLPKDVQAATESGVRIVDFRASGSTFADTDVAIELAKVTTGYNAVVLKKAPHGIVEGSPYAVVALFEQALGLLNSKRI
jgi:pimeloyl-ACP methyl ester carboxylesterase